MNNKLIQLLEIEAQEIATSYKKASIEGKGTPQEIADRREGSFVSFLRKYFGLNDFVEQNNNYVQYLDLNI